MGEFRILKREEILAARSKLKTEVVPVPEWYEDGAVLVREMTSAESHSFAMATKAKDIDTNALAVSIGVIDEEGNRQFSQNDVVELSKLGMDAIQRIVKVMLRLSGIGEEAIKEAEKNFAASPNDVSVSA